jgi:hypothetical protein
MAEASKDRGIAEALVLIGQGFLSLAQCFDPTVIERLEDAADATDTAPSAIPAAKAAPVKPTLVKKTATPAPDEDEDDDEAPAVPKADGAAAAKARAALAKLDIDEAGRPELKELADALGLKTEGLKGAELRDLMRQVQSAGGKKVVPAAKGAKPAKGPSVAEMKDDLEVFFRANAEALGEEFFAKPGKKEQYDSESPKSALILADDELVVEYWNDNVKPEKESGDWDATVEAAAGVIE